MLPCTAHNLSLPPTFSRVCDRRLPPPPLKTPQLSNLLAFAIHRAQPFECLRIKLNHAVNATIAGAHSGSTLLAALTSTTSTAACSIATMAKVTAYTPAWLSRPAPGHKLFQPSQEDLSASFLPKSKSRPGPRRTIARRGTEVFVAVGREIRWGDLVYLKDSWTTKSARSTRVKKEDPDNNFYDYDQVQPSIEGGDSQDSDGFRVRGHDTQRPERPS